MKYRIPPAHLYSRHYQRRLGTDAGHLRQRKIPPDVDLLALREVMTVKEMAARFGCSTVCVYRWIKLAKEKNEARNIPDME